MKSNISIPSNIYLRRGAIKNDIDYVQKVTGYSALKILSDKVFGTLSNSWLSDVQIEELRESANCTLAKGNEITHGKAMINGKISWVCRCEYEECEKFASCSARKDSGQIVREKEAPTEFAATIVDDEDLELEDPVQEDKIIELAIRTSPIIEEDLFTNAEERKGIDVDNVWKDSLTKKIVATKTIAKKKTEVATSEIVEFATLSMKNFSKNCVLLAEPQLIIESAPASKLWINAGPGTGKTYTVIARIIYLLENNLIKPEEILVLCYSRAAVAVIKNRIAESIAKGRLPLEANTLSIYTFDSFATRYLAGQGESLSHLNYNERIELFNKQIKPDYFEQFNYLIIDELQDLVNERALMVVNIAKNIECGFLLLGDICQAIYDFDCNTNNSLKSNEFYQMLYNLLGGSTLKYELITNNRQNKPLAQFTNEIRQVLLNSDDVKFQNEHTKDAINTLEVVPEFAENFIPVVEAGKKTAILCRNNGEAEEISTRLHRKNIPHSLLRGANHKQKLHRWIADMFWDYTESTISQKDFIERYLVRIVDDQTKASKRFDYLCELTAEKNDYISIDKLMKKLENLVDIDDLLAAETVEELVVSTIHRAKGREFDRVYLLYSENNPAQRNLDEAKIQYVAVTRPKEHIKIIKKKNPRAWHFRMEKNRGRSFKINYRLNKYFYCSGISLGHDEDIDSTSFVTPNFIGNVYDNQQYIAENIKKNDKVEIRRDYKQKRYLMYHKGNLFGALSSNMSQEFWNVINFTWNKNDIPSRLSDVHVSNIISVVNNNNNNNNSDIPQMFRKSKVWLGLEICGLAKVNFT